MKFTSICLVTKGVPALAGFYTKVLGVDAEGDDTHVELKTHGAGISIFTAGGMEAMAPGSMQGAGNGNIVIGFEVEDVDQEYERLKELAVEVVKRPESYPWGSRSAWFRDPDGNIIDLYTVLAK